jgi:light-harvesting protein B-800-850 alpha chain
MNQGRVWCVVNPTVGLPLFIGGVLLTSFTVHFAVLSNTDWMGDFLKGSSRTVAVASAQAPGQAAAPVASAAVVQPPAG